MKKAWIIITALLLIAIIGGYAAFNSIFPKADPINTPHIEDIISISVTQNNGVTVNVEQTEFEALLQNIGDSRPTRTMSVNDYPAVENYYTVTIDTSDGEYRYFIYEGNSMAYIEIPYAGIYEADRRLLDLAAEFFKNQ